MLSSSLKACTLSSHQQLEKIIVGELRAIRTKQQYISLLQLFYAYFGGLEQSINRFVNQQNLPDHDKRRKAGLLCDDIMALGAQTNKLADNESLPQINNYLQALGALYVIEGSTLGGKIICRMVAQQLNITDNTGLSFFYGYGDDTEQMWASFQQILDKETTASDQEVVMVSANSTFIKFKEWIEKTSHSE